MATDRRLYAKFDISMDDHPKIIALSDAAFRAIVESTLYARRQLTDGFIDERVVLRRWGSEVANELTSNDALRPSWIKIDGGYQIHDFGEHQTTTADIQAKRDAGRAGGLAKASKSVAPASEMLDHIDSTAPTKATAPTMPAAPSLLAQEFDSFWEHYPRKVGKAAARKAFAKALAATEVSAIQEALRHLRQEVRGIDPRFIPHPTKWLNDGRWDDEPTLQPKTAWTKEFHNG